MSASTSEPVTPQSNDNHACSRCGYPVNCVNGEYRHVQLADAVFCDVVMRAAERAAQQMGITKPGKESDK